MSAPGFNPLRWNCSLRGCFNLKRRPKIEVFADCFPRRINFGDVDGIVEINGYALMLEWKSSASELPTGQRKMYSKLTSAGKTTVLCLVGDAETMKVTHQQTFTAGKSSGWKESSLDDAKALMRAWSDYAEQRAA